MTSTEHVIDSTCLIALERIGYLDLLPALFDTLAAPPAVEREFGSTLDWLQIRAPANAGLLRDLSMSMDEGESEAIALAVERKAPIILDDKQARAEARRLGLRVTGTLRILLEAKKARLIGNVTQLIDALETSGFYLSADLKDQVLSMAGESSLPETP